MPGFHLALLCCRSFTCFDRLRKFRRNLRILQYGKKCRQVKEILNFLKSVAQMQNVVIVAYGSKNKVCNCLPQPDSWLVRQRTNESLVRESQANPHVSADSGAERD